MKKVLAVFDFDGTISKWDVLPFFCLFIFGFWVTLYKFLCVFPCYLLYLTASLKKCLPATQTDSSFAARQKIKEKILSQFFLGIKSEILLEYAHRFTRSDLFKYLLRPEALKRIAWHKHHAHYCVIVSAGIDHLIIPCGEAIGFKDVLASSLKISDKGEVTGTINGISCWGAEKVNRLEALIGPISNWTVYAYGDSRGDRELLSIATFPYYRTIPKD